MFAAARELAYAPNRTAQGLRTGNSRTIAVLGPSATDPFFAEVVRGVEEVGYERGYEVFLGFVEYPRYALDYDDPEYQAAEERFLEKILAGDYLAAAPHKYDKAVHSHKERDIIAKFLSRDVAGIILNPGQPDDTVRETLQGIPVPAMLFHRRMDDPPTDSCSSDDYRGMMAALRALHGAGHRRIAMVFGFSWPSHSARNRFRAWVDAHRELGLDLDPTLLKEGMYDMARSGQVTRELLERPSPPSAIVYWSDLMALAGMQAARELGRRIPDDVSIVGFDDLDFAAYAWPGLATIRQQRLASGRAMASRLIDRIEGLASSAEADSQIVLAAEYVSRGSAGPAPA